MASFLKVWSETLRCKSMKTPLGKILVIKTKQLVLLFMLVIMLYPVMYNQRTIDARQQMLTMQWLPTIRAIMFWNFTNFSTGSIDDNHSRKISKLNLQNILVFSLPCRNKTSAIAIK